MTERFNYDSEHYQQTNGNHCGHPQPCRRPSRQAGKVANSPDKSAHRVVDRAERIRGTLVASAKHEDMYTAINDLIAKLERQLNKAQHKPEARRATSSMKDFTPAG